MKHITEAGLILLGMSILSTALLLQFASLERSSLLPDDAVLPSLAGFIHPAALAFLVIGYAVSIAAIVFGAIKERE